MKELINRLGWVPRSCVWEITRACNLHCGHCGSSAGSPRARELSTTECVAVIEELAQLGTRHLTLSGGEPTLRTDWPEIARAANDHGMTVNMVTNGQTDADKLQRDGRATGLSNIAVSLDGLEQTHDLLRGVGAFHRATRTIQTLVSAGIWVDVMATVHRQNLEELDELHALCAGLGVKRFRVQLGKPIGNQTNRPDLTLSPRHLLRLLPSLGRLDRVASGPRVFLGDSIGYFSTEERRLRGASCEQGHWTGCYAGVQAIGIQSDGSVKGCLSLQPRAGERDPFIEGNVRESSLREIWMRPGAFAYNRAPEHKLDGACARCGHNAICRGGAKCVAYAFTGSLGQDPMCYLAAVRGQPRSGERIWPASGAAATAAILVAMATAHCGGGVSGSEGSGGAGGGGTAAAGGSSFASGGANRGGAAGDSRDGGNGGSMAGGSPLRGGAAGTGTGGAGSGQTGGSAGASGGARDAGGPASDGGPSSEGGPYRDGGPSPEAMPPSDGGPHQDGAPLTEAGQDAAIRDAGKDAVNCQNVCCMCDYGIIPPEIYGPCCLER